MDFSEYAVLYIKHKDVIKKQIVTIVPKPNSEFELEYKTKIEILSIQPTLTQIKGTIIATRNEQKNVEMLLKLWDEALKKDVQIIFLDEKNHSKWMVRPTHHDKVCEKKDREKALLSIFQSSFA
jgi:hypothetical protein